MVVEGAHAQPQPRPLVEVVRSRDGAAGALGLAHRDVLVEGRRALDGRLVGARVLVDVVGGAVAGEAALEGAAAVGRVILLDVVLDQRAGGPAVHCEESGASAGREGAGELYVSGGRNDRRVSDRRCEDGMVDDENKDGS